MQRLLLLFLLIASFHFAEAGDSPGARRAHTTALDSIHTPEQLIPLVKMIDPKYWDNDSPVIKIVNCWIDQKSDKLASAAIQQMDVDRNGYTDLLFVHRSGCGSVVCCILDSGNGNLRIVPIQLRWFEICALPVRDTFDGIPVIKLHSMQWTAQNRWTEDDRIDTLVYRFGDFIEWRKQPAAHHIEKITFHTGPCFGNCPMIWMSVDQHLKVDDRGTLFSIDSAKWQQLTSLLNYIDIDRLDTSYTIPVTDVATSTLIVTYDGGKEKQITDYGESGSYGLRMIYDILYSIDNIAEEEKTKALFHLDGK